MKIVVGGGGPSGLYAALLLKRRLPDSDIAVHEQNPRDATYGFGIILADNGLHRLRDADAESFRRIETAMYVTRHQMIVHREERIFVERNGFGGALARLKLLNILQDCCEEAGVRVHYGAKIEHASFEADLVVGADGINSAVRRGREEEFGTRSSALSSHMAWYGTRHYVAYPTLVFRVNEFGHFVGVLYPYSEAMTTFVAECDHATWLRAGMDQMTDAARQALAEQIFAPELGGEPALNNNSIWRQLPVIRCANWSVGNTVLIGDALHSAHPSIGSGTRIAMEDAIALADAVVAGPSDIPAALAEFRRVREPSRLKLLDATDRSIGWYETVAEKMDRLAPVDLVFDYMARTGRITEQRLWVEFPHFMQRYGHLRNAPAQGRIA